MAETFTPNYGLSEFDQGDNPPVCTAAKLNANWTKIDALLGGTSKAKLISLEATPAGTVVLQADVTGDTQQRFTMTCDAVMSWSSGSVAADVTWRRAGVGTFQQSAGVTPQILHQYNTTDSDSTPANYERTFVGWSGNVWSIIQQKLGTGVSRDFAVRGGNNLFLGVGATNFWKIDSATGHFFAVTDNSNDIGSSGAVRPRNIYVGTQFLAVQGSTTNPPYGFAASTNSGMLFSGANTQIIWAVAGTPTMGMTSTTTMLGSGQAFAWASAADPTGGTADTILRRGASGIVSQSNGANVQAYRLYNTTDSDTAPVNYERLNIIWSGNVCYLQTAAGGTGVQRDLGISTSGGETWRFKASGHLFVTASDNTLDIGANGANRPRSLYWGTQALAPDGSAATPSRSFAGITTLGTYRNTNSNIASNSLGISVAGASAFAFNGSFMWMLSSGGLAWANSTNLDTTTGVNALMVNEGAGITSLKNAANAQEFRVYGAVTGSHYLSVKHTGTIGQLWNQAADDIQFVVGAAGVWRIKSSGHIYAETDNSVDIGASGANRARSIYWGTQALAPDGSATAGAVSYSFGSATGLGIFKGNGSYICVTGGTGLNDVAIGAGGILVGSGSGFGFTSGTNVLGTTQDVGLSRVAQAGAAGLKTTQNGTLTSSPADFDQIQISSALAGAFTITRNNYLACLQPTGASTTTAAYLFRTDAAAGTHKMIDGSTTKTTPTAVDEWLKVNSNGNVRFIPMYASKTA